jgi:hypothetical protein
MGAAHSEVEKAEHHQIIIYFLCHLNGGSTIEYSALLI